MVKIKQKPMFLVTNYLQKKLERKIAKAEFRAEKRAAKTEKIKEHDHHDHNHDHDHEHESKFESLVNEVEKDGPLETTVLATSETILEVEE